MKRLFLSCAVLCVFVACGAGVSDDLLVLRDRLAALEATGSAADALQFTRFAADSARVREIVAAQRPDGSWPDVDYAADGGSVWSPSRHLSDHALYLARAAFASGDASLRAAVVKALDRWAANPPQCANWWWNEIGAPQDFALAALLVDAALDDAHRARYADYLKVSKIKTAAAVLLLLLLATAVFCGAAAADNPVNEQDLRAAIADSGQSTVTLGADITLTTETLTISRTVTLDLNGKTLARSSADDTPDFSVITIESGGNLMLTDSSSQGAGKITGGSADYGGGVCVNGGTFTMEGGSITGNYAWNGGGVYNKGTFTMSGGSITRNTADGIGGGGVYVDGGSFTMNGGSITGNYAFDGGGVYVFPRSTFTMSGGSITGNYAWDGGGVYVMYHSTFIVSGTPVIMNNTNPLEGVADNVYLEVSEVLSPETSSPILVFTFITLTAPLTGGEIHITTAKNMPLSPGNQFGTTTLSAGSGEEHIKSDTLKDASGNPLSAIIVGTSLMWDDTETGEVPFN